MGIYDLYNLSAYCRSIRPERMKVPKPSGLYNRCPETFSGKNALSVRWKFFACADEVGPDTRSTN